MKKKRHFVPVGNTNRDKRVRQPCGRWQHLLSRLVLPTVTKGHLLSRLPDLGQKGNPFCPGLAFPVGKPGQQGFPNRDKSTFFSSEMKICIAFRHSRLMRTHPETQYVILLINKTIWSFKNWWFKSHVSYMLFWCLEGACKKREKMHCLEKKIFQSC